MAEEMVRSCKARIKNSFFNQTSGRPSKLSRSCSMPVLISAIGDGAGRSLRLRTRSGGSFSLHSFRTVYRNERAAIDAEVRSYAKGTCCFGGTDDAGLGSYDGRVCSRRAWRWSRWRARGIPWRRFPWRRPSFRGRLRRSAVLCRTIFLLPHRMDRWAALAQDTSRVRLRVKNIPNVT
jgi:hypothetical protein